MRSGKPKASPRPLRLNDSSPDLPPLPHVQNLYLSPSCNRQQVARFYAPQAALSLLSSCSTTAGQFRSALPAFSMRRLAPSGVLIFRRCSRMRGSICSPHMTQRHPTMLTSRTSSRTIKPPQRWHRSIVIPVEYAAIGVSSFLIEREFPSYCWFESKNRKRIRNHPAANPPLPILARLSTLLPLLLLNSATADTSLIAVHSIGIPLFALVSPSSQLPVVSDVHNSCSRSDCHDRNH